MKTLGSITCGVLGAIVLGVGLYLDVLIGICDASCPSKGNKVWPFFVAGGVLWAAGAWLWGSRNT